MKIKPQHYNFVYAKFDANSTNEQISDAAEWLMYWIKFKSLCQQNGSVIFDIDDTLVDDKEKKIPSMIRLYKMCLSLGYVVNIVTARPESKNNRSETLKMLHANDILDFEALYMMPDEINTTFENISKYKYTARCDIASRHTIIANCGDMWTDHFKYPINMSVFKNRDVKECSIFFLPGNDFPCLKLPGKYE